MLRQQRHEMADQLTDVAAAAGGDLGGHACVDCDRERRAHRQRPVASLARCAMPIRPRSPESP